MSHFSELIKLVEKGENAKAVVEADRLLLAGFTGKKIISEGLVPALQSLKHKCTIENFQLLEVLLSSRAMVEVIDQVIAQNLKGKMDQIIHMNDITGDKEGASKVIVIGTIQGDIHDLGKHLVATLSSLSGIKVINLGKDVPPLAFVDAAERENADFICVSSLMTVCLPTINEIKPLSKGRGINSLIVAGGAAVQQAEEGYLDVDYRAFDAFDGINYFMKHEG
ncbi:MAG: cobalamin-dependent protein [Deltaproteobacteria bacterium]|nr:cobalamin-dependent protein [Deltaproteobacteria bacterium]